MKGLQEIYKKIDAKLQAECLRMGDRIPYTAQNGHYVTDKGKEAPFWWTNGFWAGMLWQMYQSSEREIYKETAKKSEVVMEQDLAGFVGLHHDVGFQFLHTAVADYRLTGDEKAKVMGLHAANLLTGRFNPIGGFIRAWNDGNGPKGETGNKPGWMIVDCLMNARISGGGEGGGTLFYLQCVSDGFCVSGRFQSAEGAGLLGYYSHSLCGLRSASDCRDGSGI